MVHGPDDGTLECPIRRLVAHRRNPIAASREQDDCVLARLGLGCRHGDKRLRTSKVVVEHDREGRSYGIGTIRRGSEGHDIKELCDRLRLRSTHGSSPA